MATRLAQSAARDDGAEFDLLITRGTMIGPATGHHGRADVVIRDGKVAAAGESLTDQAAPAP